MNQGWGQALVITYWIVAAMSLFITFRFFSNFPESARSMGMRFLFTAVFILFVVKLLWGAFLLIDDLTRGLTWAGQKVTNTSTAGGINRKDFLVRSGALLGAGFGAALTYGVTVGSHHYKKHRHKLKVTGLPEKLRGLKIVQISDIHSGSFWNQKAVERGVEMILDEKPDVIFFTGDMVNNEAKELDPYEKLFSRIQAPLGVYAILGNHDYADYMPGLSPEERVEDVNRLLQAYDRMGWRVLLDENIRLTHNGESFHVIGVQNWSFKDRFPRYGNLSKAMVGVDPAKLNILLSHDPTHWKGEVLPTYPQIDVTFSGHTHGMQFGVETAHFKWSPVQYVYDQWAGFYSKGNQQLYVNRGFGYLGYPGRLGIRPEIAVFELESA
ncbi:MAG: metallophosphoesterase [Flavobacteriales bacterium]|nr:metallophosphoesterase [Flavobacteriales bacterium]